jgi:hypothetical protein
MFLCPASAFGGNSRNVKMKDMSKNPNALAASVIIPHLKESAKDLRLAGPEIPGDLLMKEIEIGIGGRCNDKNFTNQRGCFWQLIEEYLGNFEHGPKDGLCILQGATVDGGGRRTAKAMLENHILMLDVDNGMSLAELEQ